ncbi:cilia- and flagella-associated protein 44 isoform X2 [Calliopsis andreniformis]|uniref:cilia- and flagella-associated protein 44 isoform X2 n=1 Tax=Calliopsis andreniformis TaxID=337506 RepID=UPI003FCD10F7
MPDETVISGCEWGNILLWDESLIKLEAFRKNKQTAHIGYITQFEYIHGELISVDGWIRFWFYETIDHADLPSEDRFLEIQPIYEFYITEGEGDSKKDAMLMCIQKQELNNPDHTFWYAQDGNGGIWLLDLCTSIKDTEQKKIFTCHAGPIVDMDGAVWGPFIATLDKSGQLHIYNYMEKKLYIVHNFHDVGSQVIWFPCEIEKTGSTLVCAFETGIIRMITVAVKTASAENNIDKDYTRLIQVLKPHTMPITVMSLNVSHRLLVTGSNDATIFTFHIESSDTYPKIIPIGYVKVPSSVTCMTWNPQEETTLLIGCLRGDCVEVKLPTAPQSYTTTSYELIKCHAVTFKFESVKSSIHREIVRQEYERRKEERREERRKELEQLQAENPHIVIDEETFLMDDDEEEMILPEIYIPEIPNRVLVAQYGSNGHIWLFMAGFDAGYVYEYPRPLLGKIKHNKLLKCRLIEAAENIEIHNCLFYKDKKYLFLTTQYGELFICKIKKENPLDFSDYWILPIHDYYNGHISKILLSYNKTMLLTCGYDGNIFSFEINDDTPHESVNIPETKRPLPLPENIEDIEDADYPSLEEVITRKEQNRIISEAEKKKNEILKIIRNLAVEYARIITRNNSLLSSQQISQFELDHRIVGDLEHQLRAQITLTREKLAFQVEKSQLGLQKLIDYFITPITCLPFGVCGILNEDQIVYSIRELKVDIDYISKQISMMRHTEEHKPVMELQRKLDDNRFWIKTVLIMTEEIKREKEVTEEEEIRYLEGVLAESYSDLTSGIGLQINQMLSKYKEKKTRLISREKEWQALYARKPNLAKSRVEDAAFLENTKNTIGEFNLKMSTGFNLSTKKETAVSKYKQLLDCRSKLHRLREDFNEKLNELKFKKQDLQKEVARLTEVIKKIHAEIPAKNKKSLPQPPKLNLDIEFPEHKLKLEKYTSMSEKVQQMKRRRQSLIIDQPLASVDLEYEVLLFDDKNNFDEEVASLSTLVSTSKMKIRGSLPTYSELLRTLNVSDSVETSWEREMKRSRMWRKIYEQDCILRYIEASYKQLEDELNELEEYRLDVIYQSTYMNLHMLTFYEEFIVLRKSEAAEYALEQKVNQKSNECSAVKLKIQTSSVKIATREEEIRKLQIKIKDVITEFTKAIAENKFYDFLQKIFKKKYTAARERTDSLDSVTQSSETSSDEMDSTIDSETGPIIFDESICPVGCDKDLYDMAFSMRQKRYTYELQIKEEQKEIELLSKELDLDTKHLRVAENSLKLKQEELNAFMLEKQKKLNDLDVTVILKLHQLQHILDSGYIADIQNCVVFNKKELSNLYARVGKLQEETNELKEKRKANEMHVKRIKLDLKYMKTQNKKLEEDIKEKMIQKFGRRISLINLYETVLQRMIYSTKTDVGKLMKNFSEEIKNIKQDCHEKIIVLENLIRCNTEKVSLLTVLEREKSKLKKILEQAPCSREDMLQVELEHMADIATLESILHSQIQQKHLLQCDIENLRTGSKKLPSRCLKENML